MRTRPLLVVIGLVISLGGGMLAACAPAPVRGFEHFYDAVAARDPAAFAALSARAQASLRAQAGGGDPAQMLVAEAPRSSLQAVTVLEDDGTRAMLEVTDTGGATIRVGMVREAGAWKVDLTP